MAIKYESDVGEASEALMNWFVSQDLSVKEAIFIMSVTIAALMLGLRDTDDLPVKRSKRHVNNMINEALEKMDA